MGQNSSALTACCSIRGPHQRGDPTMYRLPAEHVQYCTSVLCCAALALMRGCFNALHCTLPRLRQRGQRLQALHDAVADPRATQVQGLKVLEGSQVCEALQPVLHPGLFHCSSGSRQGQEQGPQQGPAGVGAS